MQQLVSYNFSTVENPLSNGGNFTTISDVDFTGSLKVIAGNKCEQVAVGSPGGSFWSGSVAAPGNVWPNDQYSEVTLTTTNANSTYYVVVRQGAANSGTQYILTLNLSVPEYILYAGVSGTVHTLLTQVAGITIAQGDVWRLSITGNVLTVTQNGSGVTGSPFTDTNNYIASGSPGFGLNDTTAIANTQTSLWAAGANINTSISLGGSSGVQYLTNFLVRQI
jgi:hypothetical protein